MKDTLKRLTCVLLALIMVAGTFPFSVFAESEDDTGTDKPSTVSSNVIEPLWQSDPEADLETEESILASIGDVKLEGPLNERVVKVAETQLGYTESEDNFILKGNNEKSGYTRYGAWFGPGYEYESWCAMFTSFCLHYAGVREELMPQVSGVYTLIEELEAREQYEARGEYTPKSGDLILFDFEQDGTPDHVGIVTSVQEENGVEVVFTIEGNNTRTVERFSYPLGSEMIMGYGVTPEKDPEEEEKNEDTGLTGDEDDTDDKTDETDAATDGTGDEVVEEIDEPADPVAYELEWTGLSEDAELAFSRIPADAPEIGELQAQLEEGKIVSAFELDLVSGGVLNEAEGSRVTIQNYLVEDPENAKLLHFGEDGIEELEYTYLQSGTGVTLSFVTPNFSPFAFVVYEEEQKPEEEGTEDIVDEPYADGWLPPLADDQVTEDTPLRSSMHYVEAPRMLKAAPALKAAGDSPAGNESFIKDFYVQAFYGGTWTDTDGDGTVSENTSKDHYVWKANYAAAGHRFSFRVNFQISNMSGFEPGEVVMRIPRRVLKDRDGLYADAYEMSVPRKADVDGGATVAENAFYAYYEDGDDLVIYNFRRIESEQQGYIEVTYRTSETSFYYKDMSELGVFTASITANDKSATAENLHVMIDTGAKITKIVKNYPTLYKKWESSWGKKPTDADDYWYLDWIINTTIDNATTQPYKITFTDTPEPRTDGHPDMQFVGYKLSGASEFTADGHTAENQTRVGIRYDHVLTRVPIDPYGIVDRWSNSSNKWDVTNGISAELTPADGIDAPTNANTKRKYEYKFKTDLAENGLWQAWKRSDGTARTYGAAGIFNEAGYRDVFDPLPYKVGEYSRYDLDVFQRGEIDRYDDFDYLVWGIGKTGAYTVQEGGDAQNPDDYFQNKVTYVLTDDVFDGDDLTPNARRDHHEGKFLEDGIGENKETLELTSSSDFQLDQLYFNFYIEDGKYDEENLTFEKTDGVYSLDDIVTVYLKFGQTGSAGSWVKAGWYNFGTSESWYDPGYATSISKNLIVPHPGCVSWKLTVSHSHYFGSIGAVPYYSLINTPDVMAYAAGKDVISLYNGSNFRVFTADEYDESEGSEFLTTRIFTRNRYDADFATGSERSSNITKSVASAWNDTKLQQYTINWRINMSETLKSGKDGSLTNVRQEGGVFYDLLPDGSILDTGSVAVRSADGGYLDSNDYIVDQVMNYKEGRTLLKVTVLKPGTNYNLFFNTLHPWASITDYGHDVYNPVAYETGNEFIADGCPDDGGTLDDASLMKDLDPDSDDPRFIYSQNYYDITTIVSAATGLQKLIREENDDEFSYSTWTNVDGNYVYRLRMSATSNMTADNLIFFDSLENYTGDGVKSDWYGTLQDIDLSQPVSMGIAPVVYLRSDRADVSGYSSVEDWDAVLANGWMEKSAFLASGHTLGDAKAVAIDLRHAADGGSFELDSLQSVTVLLFMKAPPNSVDTEHEGYPWAYNNIYLSGIIYHTDGTTQPFYNHHDYTAIGLKITGKVELLKVNAENEQEVIPSISFHLWGRSDYGTDVDMIESSNSRGQVNFKNVEKGTYLLQEYECGDDWLLDVTEYTVIVDDYGSTTIKVNGEEIKDLRLTVKDPPRVHGDLEILKMGLYEVEGKHPRIEGVKFKLEGLSDYGNDVLMFATSDNTGRVSFVNIEKGTYELTEIETDPEYVKIDTVFTVTVDEQGAVTVSAAKEDEQYLGMEAGNQVIFNPPRYFSFDFVKLSSEKNEEDNHSLEGAEFSLTGKSKLGTDYALTATSDKYGHFFFERVEPGTYTLKETVAPHDLDESGQADPGGTLNYVLDPMEYAVVVEDDGKVTIEGLEQDKDGTYQFPGAFLFYNTPKLDKHITIYKTWDPAPPDDTFDWGERTADPAGSKTGPTVHISSKEDPTVAPSPDPVTGDDGT